MVKLKENKAVMVFNVNGENALVVPNNERAIIPVKGMCMILEQFTPERMGLKNLLVQPYINVLTFITLSDKEKDTTVTTSNHIDFDWIDDNCKKAFINIHRKNPSYIA